KLHLSAEYREGSLSLQVNHQEILAIHSDLLKKTNQITAAIHSGIPGTKLLNLKVHRLVPPENTLPLFLGDTLLREKLYDKAIHSFLRIEENRRGAKVAREALIKAYQVAALYLEGEARSEITLEIKKRLAAFYPDFNPAILLEEDVCIAWKTKDYALAAVLLEKTFEYNPETLVMKKILALPHCPLSPDVGNLLLRMIRRSENIKSADLSNYGLRSLQALAGKELLALDCSGNRLHSLKGISGRLLQSLNCSGNRLVSLEEIQLPELRYLDCSSNNIKNFSVLKNIPNLTRVNLSGNPRSVTEKTLQKLPLLRHKKY
ncbi:MAG: leucine-rich repeat domain-containing protein, partial [Lentisphaeria bacterium]|nr:leucine-rich repeat domain-containing protein [Lentisphaeria bacterium]